MPDLSFTVDAEEVAKAYEWVKTHPCKFRGKYQGAIGGAVTWSFTSTSIGQIQTVTCACDAEHTIDTHL